MCAALSQSQEETIREASVLEVIHLSDLHFGEKFVGNETPAREGVFDLCQSILNDLPGLNVSIPVSNAAGHWEMQKMDYERIVCITGDFVETGDFKEFKQAQHFVEQFRQGLGRAFPEKMESIFVVPGNHDLSYDEETPEQRWVWWAKFYNTLHGTNVLPENPYDIVKLHQHPRLPLAVLTIHSEAYVAKGDPYLQCGIIDGPQMEKLQTELETAAEQDKFRQAIKIALVHHHPILIPSLVEPGRGVQQKKDAGGKQKESMDPGYDAIIGAPRLLSLLHDHGFHLLLHGHKHYPHTFTEDVVNAFKRENDHAMLVIAGGTAGSTELTREGEPAQCYNRILIHWNPRRRTVRAEVHTRRLVTKHPKTRDTLPRKRWHWETARIVDRDLSPATAGPRPAAHHWKPQAPPARTENSSKMRSNEYTRLKQNFPMVEVLPGLVPNQGYEIKFWIMRHDSADRPYLKEEYALQKVTWSAGPKFPSLTITREEDQNFCGIFHAYGSTLLVAELDFVKGDPQLTSIYIGLPTAATAPESPPSTSKN